MLLIVVIELFLDLNAFYIDSFCVACSPVDRQLIETFNSRIYTIIDINSRTRNYKSFVGEDFPNVRKRC